MMMGVTHFRGKYTVLLCCTITVTYSSRCCVHSSVDISYSKHRASGSSSSIAIRAAINLGRSDDGYIVLNIIKNGCDLSINWWISVYLRIKKRRF